MNQRICYIILVLTFSGKVCAEPAKRYSEATDLRFAPPLMGYVFDRAQAQIRTVAGIPGAARVSDAVKVDLKLANVIIGPGGTLAIASETGGTALTVVGSLDYETTRIAVENSLADFEFGSFNLSGTAAILYSSGCKCMQIIGGLADSPRVSRTIDTGGFTGAVLAIAVSDDQSQAAVAVAASEDSASPAHVLLFDLASDGSPLQILVPASAIGFTAGGKDLMLSDSSTGTVSMGRNGGALAITGGEAISKPAAFGFTEGGLLLIADRAGWVHIVDLQTNERRSVECSCSPDTLVRMKDKSIFRLTGVARGAVWILDLSGESPRTIFVPVDLVPSPEVPQ